MMDHTPFQDHHAAFLADHQPAAASAYPSDTPRAYQGGYVLLDVPLTAPAFHPHTPPAAQPWSPVALRSLNAVQDTPWAINTWLLEVVAEAWDRGTGIADLPTAYDLPMPERIPAATWARMSRDERGIFKAHMKEIHTANNKVVSTRNAALTCIQTAQRLARRPAIWFPHTLDFRGRLYPAPTAPQPQGNDLAKALIHFAHGKALGPTGLYWLCIRAANTFGQDKLALDARVAWVQDHMADITDSAGDPLDGRRFWCEADEPWSFLATCRELVLATETDPATFVSHLPVPLDGSCNGLQHLAAMARDPVGAFATNLTACPDRQDIYGQVAEVVANLVSADAITGNTLGVHWAGKVDRSTVKRAVMTTPYGVTKAGIRDQLVADGVAVASEDHGRAELANYMRDRIVEALGVTVSSARDIMAWLQGVAKALARAGRPMAWTTPAGSRITQDYREPVLKKVDTLLGAAFIQDGTLARSMAVSKNAAGGPPNLVHSFDASHLQITVDTLTALGCRDFAMVHDSFGVHAADTPLLSRVLRETFAQIYSRDWTVSLQADFQEQAGNVVLPEPPALGTFDVRSVLESQFFFA